MTSMSVPRPETGGVTAAQAGFRMPWWVLLITGALWILISWWVLAFDNSSLTSIAVLAGAVILVAGLAELYLMFFAEGWKWLHGLLGLLFIGTGIVAWVNPGKTVFWLAAFLGWYLLFKGIADIVLGFLTKADNDAWWLSIVIGVLEIFAGFWAAGRFGRSLYLLVVLVAAIALARGITDIIMAFRVRKVTQA